ncbi:MAG TPA: dipeptidase [Planctomycetes bacterium]|nr:dipeptidase [Planctomycetota bacterium]
MTRMEQYLDEHRGRFEEELCQLLRIPSISADPGCSQDIRRAAQWVADRLGRLGLAAEIIETSGHPLIYAESEPVEAAPTALVYGHYDVQPPDPLDRWISPPFEPQIRDGSIYARGATDDKGQMLTHILSVEAWRATQERLPLNLRFIIEGEEEVGSSALATFLDEHGDRLACDCVVISDGAQFGPGQPAITYGLRGIAYYELRLQGPRRDLHSGSFGGTVTNPANALTRMLAALSDAEGRIQIPGFYDDVVPLSGEERRRLAELPFDEDRFYRQLGVSGGMGEAGYTVLERRWARPTYDINGLTAGYQGDGAKTVIPASAAAKFSFRLVPHQDPEKISRGLEAFLRSLCPPGIQMELVVHHGSPATVVSLDSPYIQAAARAIEAAFGRPPVYTREGGSIPIVTAFHHKLKADTLLLGWGQDDDNAHAPNEKLCLADFHRGIRASARLWEELGRLGKDSRQASRPPAS